MNNFFVPILFIIIPGVIGVKFYKTLRNIGPKQKRLKDWEDFIEIFIFSAASYTIYGLLINIINFLANLIFKFSLNLVVYNINAFFKKDLTGDDINYYEILFTSIISIIIAILLAYLLNKKFFYHKLKKITNTKHYGDEDVWAHFLYTENHSWVYVRDSKEKLTYRGNLVYFSDSNEKREFVLNNVSVFSDERKASNKALYEVDKMYFSRDGFDLTIEIPKEINNKEAKNVRKTNSKENSRRKRK